MSGLDRARRPDPAGPRPLAFPGVTQSEAALSRRLSRPLDLAVGEGACAFALTAMRYGPARREGGLWLALSLEAGGARGEIDLPLDLVEPFLVGTGLAIDDPAVPLWLEACLQDDLAMLEASLGVALRLASASEPPGDLTLATLSVAWARAEMVERPAPIVLRLPEDLAQSLARLPMPEARDGSLLRASLEGCEVRCAVELDRACFTTGELASLRCGDVAMLPAAELQLAARTLSGPVRFLAANLCAAARLTGEGLTIEGELGRREKSIMAHDQAPSEADPPAPLEAVELTVTFEIDRQTMTLAELRGLAPGAVLPTAASVVEPVAIRANGRTIARGSLVAIGDAVGVRVETLYADPGGND